MYSASESSASIQLNWINRKTGSRCKQQYIDEKTGEKVEKEDMVKGYRFREGQYVTFTKDELKALEEPGKSSVDIVEFVPADQVDRLYHDNGYFIAPTKGGEKAYRLLAEAMKTTKLVAVGQYAARGKQYLVMLRPVEGGLVMETLHYKDEVRSIGEVPIPEGDVKPAELALAVQLIEQAKAERFRPEAYSDHVRARMLEQIQRKVDGEEIIAEPTQEPETQIIDLMEALKASLAKGAARRAAADEAAAPMKAVRGKKSAAKTTKLKRKAG